MEFMNLQAGLHFDPGLIPALRSVLPEVLRIRETFADERGALTDLELDDGFGRAALKSTPSPS